MFQQNPNTVITEIKNKYLKLNNIDESEINKLILERKNYKIEKNYIEADKIREELYFKGIIIKDVGSKTEWDIDFK